MLLVKVLKDHQELAKRMSVNTSGLNVVLKLTVKYITNEDS